jgi:hypothetical protein
MRPVEAGTPIEKNRQFLAKPATVVVLLFRNGDQLGWRFLAGAAGPGLRRRGQETTRKWLRKPLKSLKTDSEMAGRFYGLFR